jgi:hypothetical protein
MLGSPPSVFAITLAYVDLVASSATPSARSPPWAAIAERLKSAVTDPFLAHLDTLLEPHAPTVGV